ncbi:hypothetical protein GW17_00030996 [Ensete ventricosum]|nr:hypothetical protein GW17_00030996 [Ensete ventricosum]RZS01201.1 hypothetical protein BHM03_00031009 [Ensete ventricosum]
MQATSDDHELSPNMIKPKPLGLITHNRIYVCIGVSPCLVIVDLVIIGFVGLSHHHASLSPATASWIRGQSLKFSEILRAFKKLCIRGHNVLALLHPHYAIVAAAPAQAAAALCSRQSPCQGVATYTTGAAAPAGDRAGSCRLALVDPDGEDEGGQASSSLAVFTRWISIAKLLQYDLATLTQREGGE